MIALKISEQKSFMTGLLSGELFDSFLLSEATVRMAATYRIDGHLNADFFDTDTLKDEALHPYEYVSWQEIRPVCRDLIKGKKAPAGFQIILMLKPEYAERTIGDAAAFSNIRALLLNIRYDSTGLFLIPAVDFKTFSMDRGPEKTWDRTIVKFLKGKEIVYEEVS